MAHSENQVQSKQVPGAITAYWTDERIRNAKPIPKNCDASLLTTKPGLLAVTKVPSGDRTNVPFKSVGKLLFKQGGTDLFGSAFAANVKGAKNIIFTAAHCLYDTPGVATNILFIPALKDNGTKPYKSFEQINGGKGVAWFVHSQYNPAASNTAPFDIGSVKLKQNADGKDVGDLVPLFDIVKDRTLSTSTTKWQVIGYVGGQVNNVMYQSQNSFKTKVQVAGGTEVISNGAVLAGMSGGPWLLSNTEANADHAESDDATDEAIAPYYSTALVDDVLNQM